MAILPMKLDDNSVVFIEVDGENESLDLSSLTPNETQTPSDLPPGAEPTSIPSWDDMVIGSKMLQETISTTASRVRDSLKEMQPDEWSVEMNIGFESTDKGIISYLGKGNGSLKVTATWKKSEDDKNKADT